MRRDWRRTETRVVRPFASIEGSLAHVRLRLFPDVEFEDKDSFEIEDSRLLDIRPEFEIPTDHLAEFVGKIGPQRLSIIVSLHDLHLRRSEVVLEESITEAPILWQVPREASARFAWKSGVRATVAVVLNADRKPVVGEPFLRGSWLERKVFTVRPRHEPSSFPVDRWTADEFVKRGLPRDSAYWVEFITDDFNQRFQNPKEVLRLALRDEVYDALFDNERSPSGKAVRSMILSEVLTGIIEIGLENLSHGEELQRGGALYGILHKIGKSTGVTKEQLAKYVSNENKEQGRASLRLFAQAALGSRRDLAKINKRREVTA